MNRLELITRVRSLTRDLSNAIFREADVISYLNEGIERIVQVIPALSSMLPLKENTDVPAMLPMQYHHLIAVYSASRCFGQDERHYQASNFMNEFETKLDTLRADLESGRITIIDPDTGGTLQMFNATDYVVDNYFYKRNGGIDVDNGVEGVE